MADVISLNIPQETVNDESVRILAWKVLPESRVEKDQLVCEVETSKAVMELFAPAAGTIRYRFEAGSEVAVGATICEILPQDGVAAPALMAQQSTTTPAAVSNGVSHAAAWDAQPARLTPLAKRLALEHGLDPDSFAPGTLVRKDDVLRRLGLLRGDVPKLPSREGGGADRNLAIPGVPVEWAELPRRKSVEARVLGLGRERSMQSSVTRPCRVPGLRARMERLGFAGIGVTALAVFEAARLLKKYPDFNSVHEAGRIGRYTKVNVGWAVDGGLGLVVPVIPDADAKSLPEIAALMQRHVEAYVENGLAPADFLGGTFTVSDLSGFGIALFQPLISSGQAAILGIGSDAGDQRGETFYFTLAFDHQVTEGRAAAMFLKDLAERIEAHGMEEKRDGASELYCSVCQRDIQTLRRLKAVLLKAEAPEGLICSICVLG